MIWEPKPLKTLFNLPEEDQEYTVRKALSPIENQRSQDGTPITVSRPYDLKPSDPKIILKGYKSDAQRKYFHAAEERGEISEDTVKEFDEKSKGKKLPEKVSKGSLAANLPPTTYKTDTDPPQFCENSFSELVKSYLNL